MGKALERALWRMYAPHKVKLAVSGCPRNCAESGIKDVGVIGVDSGWEIYVGGNGGIKTEVAQFLVKVKTPEEVLEYSGAFLQLYREEGCYLERTVHYVSRVGPRSREAARAGRRRGSPRAVGAPAVHARRRARSLARDREGAYRPAPVRADAGENGSPGRPLTQPSRPRPGESAPDRRRQRSMRSLRADGHPGARRARRRAAAAIPTATSRCSAPPTIAYSPSSTGVLTRAARCRRASCSATASRARCTTGRSSLRRASAVAPDVGCTRRFSAEVERWQSCTSTSPDVEETRTTCPYCGVGCGVVIEHDDGANHRRARRPRSSGQPRHALQQGAHAASHRHAAGHAHAPHASAAYAAQRVSDGTKRSRKCRHASRAASRSTARTASRSTSPASCSPRTTTSSTSSRRD